MVYLRVEDKYHMDEHALDDKELKELFAAVLALETNDECSRFFDDILTINELKAMSQRLQVAKLLREGCTFNVIIERTKASSATISRVNRCIQHGSGGYAAVLDKLEAAE